MKRGHITEFLFKGAEYFVAMLDNGGVRIGMVDGHMTDVPQEHEAFAAIVTCGKSGDADAVEHLADETHLKVCRPGDCRIR